MWVFRPTITESPRLALREHRHHVALGAAGHEDGVFFAEPLGSHRFEPVYGGVLALVGVAKLGLGDRHTHLPRSACVLVSLRRSTILMSLPMIVRGSEFPLGLRSINAHNEDIIKP